MFKWLPDLDPINPSLNSSSRSLNSMIFILDRKSNLSRPECLTSRRLKNWSRERPFLGQRVFLALFHRFRLVWIRRRRQVTTWSSCLSTTIRLYLRISLRNYQWWAQCTLVFRGYPPWEPVPVFSRRMMRLALSRSKNKRSLALKTPNKCPLNRSLSLSRLGAPRETQSKICNRQQVLFQVRVW